MISKNTFVNVMTRLEELDKKMDKADNALRELSPDFGGLYIPEIMDIVVDLLEEMFRDKENAWLSYLIFDCDWLRNHTYDEPIDLSTWDEVYDFLISKM